MSKDTLREDTQGSMRREMINLIHTARNTPLAELSCVKVADQVLDLFPDTEELEKQVRQLKESDFAEIPYASEFRKVQLDGGQFVYEKVLRLIRKMEGEK